MFRKLEFSSMLKHCYKKSGNNFVVKRSQVYVIGRKIANVFIAHIFEKKMGWVS